MCGYTLIYLFCLSLKVFYHKNHPLASHLDLLSSIRNVILASTTVTVTREDGRVRQEIGLVDSIECLGHRFLELFNIEIVGVS
jgi:hypothetical protein